MKWWCGPMEISKYRVYKLSRCKERFCNADSIRDWSKMDIKSWWIVHGFEAPTLQKIILKINVFFFLILKELKYILFYTLFEKK